MTTPAPTPAPTAVPAPGEDKVAYYLAAHVLQAGETVSNICAALGVDFMSASDKIMRLSDITNYAYLMPGKTILIPMATVPTGGYYKVIAHTLNAGDTMYGLCSTYGLDYTSNLKMLQKLNDRTDLSSYYVGQTVYLPLYVAG